MSAFLNDGVSRVVLKSVQVATNRNVASANDSSFKIPRGSCCHDDDDVHDVHDVYDDDDDDT